MEYVGGIPKVLTINLLPKRCVYISKPDIAFVDWTRNANGRYDVRIKVNGTTAPYEVNDSDVKVANHILSQLSLPLIEEPTDGLCSAWESCDHYAICNGTKERELCHCGGQREKCDFYPERRKEI